MPKPVTKFVDLLAAGLSAAGDSIDRVTHVREDAERRSGVVEPDPWDADTVALVDDMERLREDFERVRV